MSTYSDASLILPVAPERKAGKIYCLKPTDGTGDFTVARNCTATEINSDGLIEEVAVDVPRFTFDTLGGCPSLLTEPQSTNLLTYSEDFSNADWTKSAISIASSSELSVIDSVNYQKLENTSNGTRYISQSKTLTISEFYTLSWFVKKGNINFCALGCFDSISGDYAYYSFDLENGVIGSNSGSSGITPTAKITENIYGYRVEMTFEATTSNSWTARYMLAGSTTTASTVLGDYIYGIGCQFEQSLYATSYIPTSGATATRLADVVTGAGDVNTFNSLEGVLFWNGSFNNNTSSNNGRITLSDGTINNRIIIQNVGATANRLQFYVIVGGVTEYTDTFDSTDITAFNKIAIKYKVNDFAVWINGVEVVSSSSGNVFTSSTLDVLNLTDATGGSNYLSAKTKEIQVYDTALTDAELQALTTL